MLQCQPNKIIQFNAGLKYLTHPNHLMSLFNIKPVDYPRHALTHYPYMLLIQLTQQNKQIHQQRDQSQSQIHSNSPVVESLVTIEQPIHVLFATSSWQLYRLGLSQVSKDKEQEVCEVRQHPQLITLWEGSAYTIGEERIPLVRPGANRKTPPAKEALREGCYESWLGMVKKLGENVRQWLGRMWLSREAGKYIINNLLFIACWRVRYKTMIWHFKPAVLTLLNLWISFTT